jgi:methyl-accepting chemotaxis protein
MKQWFEKIKLSHKLNTSLICFLLLMIVMGALSLRQLERINRQVMDIHSNWMPAASAVGGMKNAFNYWRVTVLQYVMAKDDGDDAELAYTSNAMRQRLEEFRRQEKKYFLLIVDEQERALYEQAKTVMDAYLRYHDQMMELIDAKQKAQAFTLMRGILRQKKDEMLHVLDAMEQFQFEGGARTAFESASLLQTSRWQTFFLLGLMALFGGLGFYVVRIFSTSVGLLQRACVNTFSSANHVAAVIHEQEATIGEQAASSTEIVAAAKEISATARALSVNMDDIVHIAQGTRDKALLGQHSLTQLNETMNRMVEASNAITAKLAMLNEKASNINTVLNLIVKVADQTNLLSLNAAIESERAGEYGLGFSVVAAEIRRLSDQTAIATLDIEQILKEMQSSVSTSVMGMDKFADEICKNVEQVCQISGQLTEITEQSQTLSPRFEAIYEGMQAQNLGTEQITESMTQFNEGLQQTAESLRNSRQTVTLLTEASQDLQQVVRILN